MAAKSKTALVLHGGAGLLADRSYAQEITHMRSLAEEGRERLAHGESALDVVVEIVRNLEASGFYVAGKGTAPNAAGRYELDAAVMKGDTREAGAVSALEGFLSPIQVARAVLERTPHVLLSGGGAAEFAREAELEPVRDPVGYYVPAAVADDRAIATGTVGCVALDSEGRLAAATSTGGTLRKRWGRVGDTPIIGHGTWADERVAVSCTGQGEMFMRACAAADVSARMRYAGADLKSAVQGALDDVKRLGGDGGIISVGADGEIAALYNSPGMKHAIVHPDGEITADIT
ncbi:L-asparaginase [Marinicauda pacifica]|uniref:Isoaspartyl peptidase n=1 Tax=Marinicauda pacifica TaxID=1133559 RepID=A0A4S2HBG1_9PROT|nr:isoaspartyl peptidase/L-asparaginase [Marinicauda pacifica]TGY93300.1 isoaspartyl peptidase/L-asparaginase [Marinicauda pacifica]GGE44605.1 L-asparaginase [Marinicauda pacifica]